MVTPQTTICKQIIASFFCLRMKITYLSFLYQVLEKHLGVIAPKVQFSVLYYSSFHKLCQLSVTHLKSSVYYLRASREPSAFIASLKLAVCFKISSLLYEKQLKNMTTATFILINGIYFTYLFFYKL